MCHIFFFFSYRVIRGYICVSYRQIRDFGETFEVLGLKPAYVGTAYGLAEHVVGVCGHEANLSGLPLSTFSDQDLECVGEVKKLSEGCEVCWSPVEEGERWGGGKGYSMFFRDTYLLLLCVVVALSFLTLRATKNKISNDYRCSTSYCKTRCT